jgi:hypothetical protein
MRNLLAFKWPIVISTVAIAAAIWLILSLFPRSGISLLVPGDNIFTIAEPGRYTIWSQVEGSFQGKLMTFPTGLPPGVSIAITRADGSIVPIHSQWPTTHRDSGRYIQVAIGSITFDSPGKYRLTTEGLEDKRGLYLDRSDMRYFFVKVVLAMFIPMFLLGGVVWSVVIFISRRQQPA